MNYTEKELTTILARHRQDRLRGYQISCVVFFVIGALCGAALTLLVTK